MFTGLGFTDNGDGNHNGRTIEIFGNNRNGAWGGGGFYPGNETVSSVGGDFFVGSEIKGTTPWDRYVIKHELLHALGFKEPEDGNGWGGSKNPNSGRLSWAQDHQGNTIMSKKGLVGVWSVWELPQTFMQLDIAGLQTLYGANYADSYIGDTVYSWNEGSPYTMADGHIWGGYADESHVYVTIWDGGGVDTFDMSAFDGGVNVNLIAGAGSNFGDNNDLLAKVTYTESVPYNVYIAKKYNGDWRSNIENAIGGNGNDRFQGNEVGNKIDGRGGNDTIALLVDNQQDVVVVRKGDGSDTITGFEHNKDKIQIDHRGDVNHKDILLGNNGIPDVDGKVIIKIGGPGSDPNQTITVYTDGQISLEDNFLFFNEDTGQYGEGLLDVVYDVEIVPNNAYVVFGYDPSRSDETPIDFGDVRAGTGKGRIGWFTDSEAVYFQYNGGPTSIYNGARVKVMLTSGVSANDVLQSIMESNPTETFFNVGFSKYPPKAPAEVLIVRNGDNFFAQAYEQQDEVFIIDVDANKGEFVNYQLLNNDVVKFFYNNDDGTSATFKLDSWTMTSSEILADVMAANEDVFFFAV